MRGRASVERGGRRGKGGRGGGRRGKGVRGEGEEEGGRAVKRGKGKV